MTYIKSLIARRGLLLTLTFRDLQVRYKQSVLGILWAVLQPLSLMLMFTLIFSLLLKVPSDGLPYPIFVYSALLPWTFFANALGRAVPSIESNSSIIKKVYFPRELIPLSSVLATSVDFVIGFAIFLGMMLYYHVPFTPYMLYVIPILAIQIAFTVGISLFASALNAYYRDVRHALPLVTQLWMYASPVIYPISQVPERLKMLYLLNPMAGIMEGYRACLVKATAPTPLYLGIAAAGAVIMLVFGWWYFKRTEMSFVDVV
ncbi:MAG: ABC transporter permease [Sphaerochaeta sp.]|jgi:lipopolysaccharide transport system permease protein|nr:ABC transporter permease [Sphaerochaeta sp.]